MNAKTAMAAASVILVAATGALAQPQWKHVGSIGQRHFVVVEPAVVSDTQVLKQAAVASCPPAKTCVVAFWSDAAAVPASMPMTREQREAVVAQYLRNPTTGTEELLLRCSAESPPGAKCLR